MSLAQAGAARLDIVSGAKSAVSVELTIRPKAMQNEMPYRAEGVSVKNGLPSRRTVVDKMLYQQNGQWGTHPPLVLRGRDE